MSSEFEAVLKILTTITIKKSIQAQKDSQIELEFTRLQELMQNTSDGGNTSQIILN